MPRARFKFVIYRDDRGEWRWRLVSRNGNIVANCGEGYRHKGDALRMVAAIREGKTWDAPVVYGETVQHVQYVQQQKYSPAAAAKRASRAAAEKRATKRP